MPENPPAGHRRDVSLEDVQVGAADRGDVHLHDHVIGADDLRVGYVLPRLLYRSVVHQCLHQMTSLSSHAGIPAERIDRNPPIRRQPIRDRRLTVPTRPPGEQTSVSVRNATGVRSNAYAARLGWQAKVIATYVSASWTPSQPVLSVRLKSKVCVHQPLQRRQAGRYAAAGQALVRLADPQARLATTSTGRGRGSARSRARTARRWCPAACRTGRLLSSYQDNWREWRVIHHVQLACPPGSEPGAPRVLRRRARTG